MSMLKEGVFSFHIYFVDDQHGWLMTSEELFGTGDGGRTWAPKIKIDYATYGVVRDMFFLNKNTGWLVTSEGFILKCSS